MHEHPKLEYRLCDLFNLNESNPDLKDADVVVCQNSMHHFSDETLYSFFKAGIDLLKKGGNFYVSDYRREELDAEFLAQRLIATNKLVREDLVHTFQAALTKKDIEGILNQFGDTINYKIFHPDEKEGIFDKVKSQPDYETIIANDRHPHYLDYKLSLRIQIEKR
jgi:SAM-dependent methyltransferase